MIIGIGNPLRGDDGAGIAVARRVKEQLAGEVDIIEQDGDGLQLLEVWRRASLVFLVDAMSSGTTPGTIAVFDVAKQHLPFKFFLSSTHIFGLPQAIELARALEQLPPKFLVFGIEGQNFELGSPLSEKVTHAINQVVSRLREKVDRYIRAKVRSPRSYDG